MSSVTESKDEDERGDNRRQQLVKEEERRVTEQLVQFCHHLRQFGLQFLNLNVAGQAPGKCGLPIYRRVPYLSRLKKLPTKFPIAV